MDAADGYLLATTHARDAAYDVILLAHVLAAVVGLGALVIAGANAWALQRSGPDTETLRRYYRPGANWAGRVLFAVPILGFSLMAMSHGDWSFSDTWITIGLALWAVVAVSAEVYLWPAERRLQVAVSALPSVGENVDTSGQERAAIGMEAAWSGEPRPDPDSGPGPGTTAGAWADARAGLRSECLRVAGLAVVLSVVLVAIAVIMVAKP